MSAPSLQADPAGAPAHREAQDLLPWLANGSLAGEEGARVEAHLGTGAQCRADRDTVYTLRDAADAPLPGLDPEAALARLLPQLDAPAPAASAALPALPGWRARLAANDARWLRVAMALQFCAIAVLTAMLVRPGGDTGAPPDAYRVLGADAATGSVLVVTFRPGTPEHELRRIVLASGARVVGGPTVTGAWMLGSADAADAVAARLRSQPAVTLAEPLETGAPQ